MKTQYDVIVIGGGTAGAIAAIQSARAGASTLLVEKNAMLGGTLTVAAINAPSHFFVWGRQVIAGIGWELVRRTLEETGIPIPDPVADGALQHTPKVPRVDIAVYAALCDQAALDAGVELLFHTMPATANFIGDRWYVSLCTRTGLRTVDAAVLIDATGDAAVVALAGLPVIRPDIVQPATLQLRCAGYDPDKLDYAALKAAADRAIAAGVLMSTDVSWKNAGPEAFLRRFGANCNHIRAPRAETSEGRSAAEIEGRRSVLRVVRFFRKQAGLENFRIDWIAPEIGIRETVTIRGKTTVTVTDYEAGKLYDDAICYAYYPIDEHLNDGHGINYRKLAPNTVPTIPRGALLPGGSRNLIVAGRCLSSDREANSALRVQAPCMAMGQAAGAMAALSARSGIDPEQLPLTDIHALLRQHNAIVPTPA